MDSEDCIKIWKIIFRKHRSLEDQNIEASDSKSIKWRLNSNDVRL
jgi:hypothetical protein